MSSQSLSSQSLSSHSSSSSSSSGSLSSSSSSNSESLSSSSSSQNGIFVPGVYCVRMISPGCISTPFNTSYECPFIADQAEWDSYQFGVCQDIGGGLKYETDGWRYETVDECGITCHGPEWNGDGWYCISVYNGWSGSCIVSPEFLMTTGCTHIETQAQWDSLQPNVCFYTGLFAISDGIKHSTQQECIDSGCV